MRARALSSDWLICTALSHRRHDAALQVHAVAVLGVTVLSTCALCWLPYLGSAEEALRVLSRITPVQRGLFEDYVANVWCSSHPLFHWKQRFDQMTLVRLCMGALPHPPTT